jgi:hypothetical protein
MADDGLENTLEVAMATLPHVWDYDISEEQFQQMLDGKLEIGRLNQR